MFRIDKLRCSELTGASLGLPNLIDLAIELSRSQGCTIAKMGIWAYLILTFCVRHDKILLTKRGTRFCIAPAGHD